VEHQKVNDKFIDTKIEVLIVFGMIFSVLILRSSGPMPV